MSDSKICAHCGSSNKANAVFCSNVSCGKLFELQDSNPQPDPAIAGGKACPYCGTDNRRNAVFCSSNFCGRKLDGDDISGAYQSCHVCGRAIGAGAAPPISCCSDYAGSKKPKRIFALAAGLIAFVAVALCALYLLPSIFSSNPVETIINPNVVVYEPGGSSFEILDSDFESVTVSTLNGIEMTTILAAGITEETPDGLLRLIESIEEVPEGYRLNTMSAALTDAIEQCDISFVAVVTEDGEFEISYLEGDFVGIFDIPSAVASSFNHTLLSREESFGRLSAGLVFEGSLRIELRSRNVEMRLTVRCYARADISMDARFEWEQTLKRLNKPLTFSVGGVPVVLSNELRIDASFAANASAVTLEVDMAFDRTVGFVYSTRQGLRAINENNSSWPDNILQPGSEIFNASLNAELGVVLTSRLYGLAGPSISTALEAELKADLRRLPDEVVANDAIVLPGPNWRLSGSYSEKVTIPIRGQFVIELPGWVRFNPFDRSPVNLANFELFNTGDAITLSDVNLTFGHPDLSVAENQTEQEPNQETVPQGNIRTFTMEGPAFEVSFEYNADLLEEVGYESWFAETGGTGFGFVARNNPDVEITVSSTIAQGSLTEMLEWETAFARSHGEITSERVGANYIFAEGTIHSVGTGIDHPAGYVVINQAFQKKYFFNQSTENWLSGVHFSYPSADSDIWDVEARRIIDSLRISPRRDSPDPALGGW